MPRTDKKPSKTKTSRRKARRANSKPGAASSKSNKKTVDTAVLNPAKLQELYATMLKCRMLHERAQSILPRRTSLPNAAMSGGEAVLTGAMAHVLPADAIVTAHSGFLASFIKGTPLNAILAQLNAARPGVSADHKAGQNGVDSRAQVSLAHGMALAAERKGNPTVVLVFTGEDQAALSAHHESLSLAAKDKLPLVCLMETASSASSIAAVKAEVQLKVQPAPGDSGNSFAGGSYHFPQIAVDGTDVVAIFRVAQEAVRRARGGHGPSLIECVMPDAGPRQAAQAHKKDSSDPLAFMQQYLQRRSLWSDEWQRKIVAEFKQELDAAITATKNASDGQSSFDQVYSPDRPPVRSPQMDKAVPSGA